MRCLYRFLRRLPCLLGWHDYAPQIVWGERHCWELRDFCFYCGKPREEDDG